jgi:hypothetical protein
VEAGFRRRSGPIEDSRRPVFTPSLHVKLIPVRVYAKFYPDFIPLVDELKNKGVP